MDPTQRAAQASLMQMVHGYGISQAIYVVAKLGVADLLAGGPKTSEELARSVAGQAGPLFRILRALASVGVLRQDGETFGLTPISECLRSDRPGSLRSAAILFGEEPYHAFGSLLQCVTTGELPFERLYGAPYFRYMRDRPEVADTFNRAMTELTARSAGPIVAACDLSGVRTLVDVGGGHGLLTAELLKRHPSLRAVVFDLPQALCGTRALLQDAGVTDRCEIVAGDCFEAVPPADAYLLKGMVHDWSDHDAGVLLRQCRRAIAPDGLLLLVEWVLPEGGAGCGGKLVDLDMMVMCGGRERTEAEFRALCASADFELQRIRNTDAGLAVIHASPV